jgi:ribonuclease HI
LFNLAIEPLACSIRNSDKLEGYQIPGLDRKLVVALFADDTTVYLSQNDRLDDLNAILDTWCQASGAKFNVNKTEVIPIGSKEHRSKVAERRTLHDDDEEPPNTVRIAKDGEWVRILGAPIGNGFSAEMPWNPTIEKIRKSMNMWSRARLTIQGKRLIVQMIVGGMSQFRTAVQGMPEGVVKELTSIIREFVWDGKRPLLSMEYIQLPQEEGGMGILDLDTRNEAIDVERLKRYLNMNEKRCTWGYVVDALIQMSDPKPDYEGKKTNFMLQNWTVPTQGRGWGHELPQSVVRMLKTANKHKATVEALRVDEKVLGLMPAWHHIGKKRARRRNQRTDCIYETHGVRTIADLLKITKRIGRDKGAQKHSHNPRCKCNDCKSDRALGCPSPWRCAEEALEMLKDIKPKWNGLETRYEDGLTLNEREIEQNEISLEQRELVTFNPSVTVRTDINACIRIFTNPTGSADEPAKRTQTQARGRTSADDEVIAYTDGSSINNGSTLARCGAGVWFEENDERNISIRPPTSDQSNQVGEIAAIILAAQAVPNFVVLQIRSDSLTTIEGLTKNLTEWEDIGWIGVKNSELLKVAAYQLRKRNAPTYFQWVKGHSGERGNDGADELAGKAAARSEKDDMDLEIPAEYRLTGARLDKTTQALAYKAIRTSKKAPKTRERTNTNLEETRTAIKEYTNTSPTNEGIWKSTRHKDIRLPIRQFLYKMIHSIHKIGKYWTNIPGYEDRGICRECGALETMEHILLTCETERRKTVWTLAEETWADKEHKWPDLREGTIMGCGMLSATRSNNDDEPEEQTRTGPSAGQSRLLRILISESAFLIWKMRNEATIDEIDIPTKSVVARWKRTIESRLQTDRAVAARKKKDMSQRNRVEATWARAIGDDGQETPEDWAYNMNRQVELQIASNYMRFFSGSSPTLPDHPYRPP